VSSTCVLSKILITSITNTIKRRWELES